MKIAVLADDALQQEWLHKDTPGNISIEWVGSMRIFTASDADAYFDLLFENDRERTEKLTMRSNKPVFINSVSYTTKQIGHHFIRLNAWPGFLQRNTQEIAIAKAGQETIVQEVFTALGWNYQLVPDTPGMITARIIAMIINEAYFTLGDHISTKQEIDIAMKLGTSYPMGPFEWSEKIGLQKIYELLKILSRTDDCYRVAPALEEEVKKKESR